MIFVTKKKVKQKTSTEAKHIEEDKKKLSDKKGGSIQNLLNSKLETKVSSISGWIICKGGSSEKNDQKRNC